jgi:hypothetical protein
LGAARNFSRCAAIGVAIRANQPNLIDEHTAIPCRLKADSPDEIFRFRALPFHVAHRVIRPQKFSSQAVHSAISPQHRPTHPIACTLAGA